MSAWLGVGLGLRAPHVGELRAAAPMVLELTPSHYLARPERLDGLIGRHRFVLHDVCASLATVEPLDLAYLDRVADLARHVGAVAYSEHLAMTRIPGGIELGHLVPVPRTPAQLELLTTKLEGLAARLELPVAIELPTTSLALPPQPGSMSEAVFVRALIEQSGCGLHLDLDNLWIDARNAVEMGLALGLEPEQADEATRTELDAALTAAGIAPDHAACLALRLASLPLHAVTRIHLAGGHEASDGWAVDSHSGPSSAASRAMLVALRGRIQPRAIIIERDAELPPLAEMLAEIAEIDQLWT